MLPLYWLQGKVRVTKTKSLAAQVKCHRDYFLFQAAATIVGSMCGPWSYMNISNFRNNGRSDKLYTVCPLIYWVILRIIPGQAVGYGLYSCSM